ncbi:hypothetical protein [Clostridium sp.]|uniref:hypothetical protein n=1 Tax=Clostridium sp. TaxID=1506 RepID=UPI001B714A8C|nr:hypothetical protein [Clostridium sp.]MBP3915702.1 hypothetical protein [Clostridium sp.]
MQKTINYEFSHNIFKNLVLSEHDFMMAILSEGEEAFEKIINEFWKNLYGEFPEHIKSDENEKIKVSSEFISSQRILVIMEMPHTEITGDCSIIGFTFGCPGEKMRYFTYEQIKDKYLVGEWVSNYDHKYFNNHDSYSPEKFVLDIKKEFNN